eukprot:TRINITY_DN13322_c0_g1_i7.p1 TRINITY_DN13322_c0_g1~~TRINITY_DN13322_c0_g1_i7.p1  ORF type:complete len:206 (-),score=16.65 TRINITY_DN13322_c0_g1_i7:53-625(-)
MCIRDRNELIVDSNLHTRKFSKMQSCGSDHDYPKRFPLIEIPENMKEVGSPIFVREQGKELRSDSSSELISTLQIEKIFNEYVQKDIKHNEIASMSISCTSCLRYLPLKDVLNKLSLKKRLPKYEFARSIMEVLKRRGLDFDVGNLELGRIYSVVGPKNESLKELVGALSILCSGTVSYTHLTLPTICSV